MLIDTHVHLTDDRYKEDLKDIIDAFEENNIEKVINIGYDLTSSKAGYELTQKHERIFAALGVHPNDASEYNDECETFIKQVAGDKKVVAIGEIGLDYYWNKENKDLQKQVFIKQLQLANELNLPIVIHVREAYGDMLELLKEYKHLLNNSGVMHCFGGSLEYAKEVLKLGLYLGFDGPITFKNSNIAEEVVKYYQ